MRFPKNRCLASLAVAALLAAAVWLPAHAETGTVRFKFSKAGWFVGAQAGGGILSFRREIYPFRIGGLSAGLTFGGSSTDLVGTARNMHQASDIEGIYTALGACLFSHHPGELTSAHFASPWRFGRLHT
jgi:hypothetical protein